MENNSAIIYARVSSSGYLANRQDTSRQVADLQAYADFTHLNVIKVFEEHVSGAKKKDERPVLVEAMDFCKQNNIGMVLVSELSRLGRNAFETLSVVKELKDNGINIYLQKEQFSLFEESHRYSLL
jgi:DNA invertase Pin-like site-specific DNA recombinase